MTSQKCKTCNKVKTLEEFSKKGSKTLVTCNQCRENSRVYKQKNADKIKDNNAFHSSNRQKITQNKKFYILVRPVDSDQDWVAYATQKAASDAIGAQPSNLSKVIKGELTQTAGHNIRFETEEEKSKRLGDINTKNTLATWKEYQESTGRVYENKCAGMPSQHRKPHIFQDGVEGKMCSRCKKWNCLSHYNYSKSHWDNLRVDCKTCLHEIRSQNVQKIRDYNIAYWQKTKEEQTERNRIWKEKNRDSVNAYARQYKPQWEKHQRETNPQFKIIKNMRCRLYTALKGHSKSSSTWDYIGMDRDKYMDWIEFQFYDGMTWENYGTWWHIDHVKPCVSFDMEKDENIRQCFGWWNTCPLVAKKNLQKGSKNPNEWTFVMQELKAYVFLQISE